MKGQKALDSSKQVLAKLGKLAWKGLCEPEKKLIFEKVMEFSLNVFTEFAEFGDKKN